VSAAAQHVCSDASTLVLVLKGKGAAAARASHCIVSLICI